MTENEIIEYKCPCCGGKIEFDSSIQKMKCPYCDTEFEIDTLKGYDEVLKEQRVGDTSDVGVPETEWSEGEQEALRSYICKSCGGEIMTDATTAATHCPFCSNPVVLGDKLSGGLRPELVIPFKLNKKQAKEQYLKHLGGKKLLPKVFKDQNHIDEIKGVYVPVWLYGAKADADITYRATKIRSWSDSNYDYTETTFFSVVRGGKIAFANVPVDGSSKMDDTMMESIEPYDFKDAVNFETAYLSGYFADRYDVGAEDSNGRANSRMKTEVERSFAQTVKGYASVNVENSSVNLSADKTKYALYPVWLLNTNWNGKKYYFAMNGQTGKFVGDLPVDNGAYFRWLIGLTVGIGAAVLGILSLLMA